VKKLPPQGVTLEGNCDAEALFVEKKDVPGSKEL
jgi:hypothetical protein